MQSPSCDDRCHSSNWWPYLNLQCLGLLCTVRMFSTRIALHFLQHCVAERPLGQHALDGFFQHAFRKTLLQLGEVGFINSTRIAGVAKILLVLGLVAGHTQLIDIDHDDIVACIDVRGVHRLVFAAQALRNFSCKTSQHFVSCIDDEPVALDFMRLGRKRFHEETPILMSLGQKQTHGRNAESRALYVSHYSSVKPLPKLRIQAKKTQPLGVALNSPPLRGRGGEVAECCKIFSTTIKVEQS
ncbi:protein of unknown function [Georgfuchsia toluolica]|uniref:Uncharacterized protein n=1 Tax=Georgfuchsia toluolica TaxID=424218 RepID=A0A916J6E6_9PROT|nr:protein of unknown function [Georgfuchsia toluolica]